MIVVRFKVTSQPAKREQLRTAFANVINDSRAIDGVINFDIAQDLNDPNTFIATEVFADDAARARQEALPDVMRIIELLPSVLAAAREATVYEVASTSP